MAVHCVRVFIEANQGQAPLDAIDLWKQNFNEWEDDPVNHAMTDANTAVDGSGTDYVRGDYRYIQDSTAADILDDLETRLVGAGTFWYRIGYHDCDHDEDSSTSCGWEEDRENGTIPADIPDLS